MINLSKPLLSVLIQVSLVLLLGNQSSSLEWERELHGGQQAAEQSNYAEAVTHFTKANQLQQDRCSECYVWLARIEMAEGKLRQALEQTEKGTATATTATQKASAHLYRGIVLSRQGDTGQAWSDFRAGATAHPSCVGCRFNLGLVPLNG